MTQSFLEIRKIKTSVVKIKSDISFLQILQLVKWINLNDNNAVF